MTLDEAIAHAREVSSEQKRRSGVCIQNDSECDKISACLKCAEEHEQLADWLEELKQYREIGTIEECRVEVEKMKSDEELESHDEKHILKYCISLMQEMVDEFADWYKWLHGKNAISEMDDEEIFCVRKSYFRIVKKLFLFSTKHSGGTSTRAKCKQLGVDSSEEITFDWSEVE